MLKELLALPTLADFGPSEIKAVKTLRLWALLQNDRAKASQAIVDKLGSRRAAAHFHLFLDEVADAWPDPFVVSPLCCGRVSHDEALLAQILSLGNRDDRAGFDRLVEDMFGPAQGELMFLSAKVLSRYL